MLPTAAHRPSHRTALRPAPQAAVARLGVAGRGVVAWLAAGLVATGLVAAAHAQPASSAEPSAAVGSDAWREQMSLWLRQQAQTQVQGAQQPSPLRVDVEVGSLDSRLRLAPCQRVEPYLPSGTRLWGRARIGLRCTQGPVAWNVFLPIYVRVWGPGWVVRQPLAGGETLQPHHAEAAEVDWTLQRQPVLVRQQDWVGQQLVRGLAAGQVLHAGSVRAPQVFASGAQVRLRVQGEGFTIVATGEALGDGHVGESVRVRLPSKRVVLGTVVDATTVDVAL
ncbi:MAG: flagellar basal body P-ring formation chaperone FlgA [Tepidimonas ignava]|uniref:flagellar basal body P-ring formation chaperone FlgA n=1 Tax=Tepidimonas ignava TaxID=114249 RepID=UPI002FDA24D3